MPNSERVNLHYSVQKEVSSKEEAPFSETHSADRLASQVARSFRPELVLVATLEQEEVLAALWALGIESYLLNAVRSGDRMDEVDVLPLLKSSIEKGHGRKYDVAIVIEGANDGLASGDDLNAIASLSKNIVFAPLSTSSAHYPQAAAKPMRWWLGRFADLGFAPSFDFDASFLAPNAILMQPSESGCSARQLAAACELVRLRELVAESDASIRAAQTKVVAAEAALEAAKSETGKKLVSAQKTIWDLDEMRRRAAEAELRLFRSERERASESGIIAQRRIADLQQQFDAEQEAKRSLEAAYIGIFNSPFWRATRPIRSAVEHIPAPMRRLLRGSGPTRTPAAQVPVSQAPALPETEYDRWVRDHDTLTVGDLSLIRQHCERMTATPVISVIMPVYDTPETYLREAIASVRAQIYPHWELCICDDASPSEHVTRIISAAADEDTRIRWVRREVNGHISAASNDALALATGEFVAFMDHDDLLRPHSLYSVAVELVSDPKIDMLFTDEDRISDDGRRHTPTFKPGWNAELLMAQNYVCHLSVYRRDLVARIGGLRLGVEGSQDFDLALRASAAASPGGVRHLPGVLYHWRQSEGEIASFSQSQLDRCIKAARIAITDHLRSRGDFHGQEAWVGPAPATHSWSRVNWPVPSPAPKVSIIIPTRNHDNLLAACAAGVLHRTDYPNIEVIIADNGSDEPPTLTLLRLLQADPRVKVVPLPGPFNYSVINNAAARHASGDILVLMNNDIDIIGPNWLHEMVSLVTRPEVGLVGAKLLYGNGLIQHAGVALGIGGFAGGPGVAGHYSVGDPRHEISYLGHNALTREVSAVTAACLAVRKEVFESLGGLDEENLTVAFNDIDFSIRVRRAGLRVVWTPYAEMYHLESASRGYETDGPKVERFRRECRYMRRRWGPILDSDPFHNPVFSRLGPLFKPVNPSRKSPPWRATSKTD